MASHDPYRNDDKSNPSVINQASILINANKRVLNVLNILKLSNTGTSLVE